MRFPDRIFTIVARTIIVMLVSGAASCGTDSSLVRHRLDPVTSVTISYSHTPMVFYRPVAGRAAYARDYLHIAPLEVNRSGRYRYYLWFGIWNTMQDARFESSRAGFDSVVIFADGEPLPLEVSGWTPAAIGASAPVFVKPVASASEAYYEIDIDQLRLIAESKDVRVQATDAQGATYESWDSQKAARADLLDFLRAAAY